MANRYSYLLYFLFGFLMLQNIQAQQSRRMYFVGNSVTDAMNYGGLKSIAESRGNIHTWARLMIPGSPLELLWDARTSGGFTEKPYGKDHSIKLFYGITESRHVHHDQCQVF